MIVVGNRSVNETMQDIDFLPADYRRRRTNRHGRSWQILAAGAVVGLIVVVAVGQTRALRQVETRLAEIAPQREMFESQKTQLGDLRKQLSEAEAEAELIAYMRHPWPKTQLLAETLRCLPEEVVCSMIRIARETQMGQVRRQRGGDSEEEDLTKLEPATRDLRLLQEECDFATVTVVLEGTTADGIKLHQYLQQLNDVPLLSKVELQSLESTHGEADVKFRFEARLTVRPGFGQPNGPDGRSHEVAQAGPGDEEATP